MKKKNSVSVVTLIAAVSLVTLFLTIAASQTTPVGLKQRAILGTINRCIWYGYKKNIILSESDGEKKEIILPESLMDYPPLVVHFDLEEFKTFTNKCDLIYNPQGYQDKTWIVIYNSDDFKTRLFGNYVLWSNKDMRRERGILKDLNRYDNLKYYCIPD